VLTTGTWQKQNFTQSRTKSSHSSAKSKHNGVRHCHQDNSSCSSPSSPATPVATTNLLPDGPTPIAGLARAPPIKRGSNLSGLADCARRPSFSEPLRAGVAKADTRLIKAVSDWRKRLARGVDCRASSGRLTERRAYEVVSLAPA
jgi:hypothetical protein